MVKIVQNPKWVENAARCKDGTYPCVICGKPCPKPSHYIHEHDGGGWAVTEEEAATLNPGADLGAQPVGNDCWKKHPELHPYEWK